MHGLENIATALPFFPPTDRSNLKGMAIYVKTEKYRSLVAIEFSSTSLIN